MKRIKPKDFRDTGIMEAIVGLIFACVGGYFVLFSDNEGLIEFTSLFIALGSVSFLFGVFHALNYKNTVRKMIEKAGTDLVYEITENKEDITDELIEQILTKAVEAEQKKKKLITPKHRKGNGILSIYFGLIMLIFLVISILHEGAVDRGALMFIGFMNFLFTYGIYILVTLRKHNIEYFREYKFANPTPTEGNIYEDNIEEYVDDLAKQDNSRSPQYSISFVLLTLLLILAISAVLKSKYFFFVTTAIVFIAIFYIWHFKNQLKEVISRKFKADNIDILINKANLYILLIAGFANLVLSLVFLWLALTNSYSFLKYGLVSKLLVFYSIFNFVIFVFLIWHYCKFKKKMILKIQNINQCLDNEEC